MKFKVAGHRYFLEGANSSESNLFAMGNRVVWFKGLKGDLPTYLDNNLDTWTYITFVRDSSNGSINIYKDGLKIFNKSSPAYINQPVNFSKISFGNALTPGLELAGYTF